MNTTGVKPIGKVQVDALYDQDGNLISFPLVESSLNLFRFIPAALRPSIAAGTNMQDLTSYIQPVINFAKSFGPSNTELEIVWPAGTYHVTSLDYRGANRVINRTAGAVNILGIDPAGTSIININGGIVTPTTSIKFLGYFAVQIGSGGAYQYGIDVSYVTSSELHFFGSGAFSVAAFNIDYSWDNDIWVTMTNTTNGAVWVVKCGNNSTNENVFRIRGSCDGDMAHPTTVMVLKGYANIVTGDFNSAQNGLDITGAVGPVIIAPYFETVKNNIITGVGAGTAKGTTIIGGTYEAGTNGAAFSLGTGGGSENTTIISPRIRGTSGGANRTAFALGAACFYLNVFSPDIDSVAPEAIDNIYTGTWNGATGGLPMFGVQTTHWISFPPVKVSSADPNTQDDYAENTWVPSFTNLTIVLGGGSVTYTGAYTKIGRLVFFTAQVKPAGGATTQSVAGTTYINNLPFMSKLGERAMLTASDGGIANLGVGLVFETAGVLYGYTPNWGPSVSEIYVSGVYQSND